MWGLPPGTASAKACRWEGHGNLQTPVGSTEQLDKVFWSASYEGRREMGESRGTHHGPWLLRVEKAMVQSWEGGQMSRLN